jgi:hypothetical protein
MDGTNLALAVKRSIDLPFNLTPAFALWDPLTTVVLNAPVRAVVKSLPRDSLWVLPSQRDRQRPYLVTPSALSSAFAVHHSVCFFGQSAAASRNSRAASSFAPRCSANSPR